MVNIKKMGYISGIFVIVMSVFIIILEKTQQESIKDYNDCVQELDDKLEEQTALMQVMTNNLIGSVNFNIDSVKDIWTCSIRSSSLEPYTQIDQCRFKDANISESSKDNELMAARSAQYAYWNITELIKQHITHNCEPKLKDYSSFIYVLALVSGLLLVIEKIFSKY